ncbi:MAG TPA: enoyl-CoA hydratase/isomerase family protein [Bacillales bacterium]
MRDSVLYKVENGIGWMTLNRPKAINSLSFEVVTSLEKQLIKWEKDPEVALICLIGAGKKGFCAGGDVRELYEQGQEGNTGAAVDYFATEYRVDQLVHQFPKPILVYMDGIVMGGGVGLSIGASHRIVTENTKWGMPEMNIGFFPDVGSSYYLNQMPGELGRFLALTATIVKPEDVLYAGAADYNLPGEEWPRLEEALREKHWSPETANEQLSKLLDTFCVAPNPTCELAERQVEIDRYFSKETVEEILESLSQAAAEGNEWASAVKEEMLKKSPTSLKVTLEQLKKGKGQSLEACFAMERTIAMNFMHSHDFYEGVRAVLVDKDHNPKWQPPTINEVSAHDVVSFFEKKDSHK